MCEPKERIDEPTVGHGAGMIIKPAVVEKAIDTCEKQWGPGFKIFFSPQGQKLDQFVFKKLAQQLNPDKQVSSDNIVHKNHIILICSRYEGIDARVEEHYADLVLSIGDFVIMGGDLAAQVFLEGFLRLIPQIVGKQESVENESFSSAFLDHPEYGLPVEWKDRTIPEILRSGNHGAVDVWRKDQAAEKTVQKRFDWFANAQPTQEEIDAANKHIPTHYVALLHSQVLIKNQQKIHTGNTSIASIDIHDAARASATYGVKNVFIVTELEDQQVILKTFLNFWTSDKGQNYNATRHRAVSSVIPSPSLDFVIESIKKQTGKDPIIIATSAKPYAQTPNIDYFSQGTVWRHQRPVLFVFGTGQGLCNEVLNRCDFMLLPLTGLTKYNHLSVRSAISIVLDRWLGLHPKIR